MLPSLHHTMHSCPLFSMVFLILQSPLHTHPQHNFQSNNIYFGWSHKGIRGTCMGANRNKRMTTKCFGEQTFNNISQFDIHCVIFTVLKSHVQLINSYSVLGKTANVLYSLWIFFILDVNRPKA